MKQSRHERLAAYQALVRAYSASLDLLSPTGLANLQEFVDEALLYPQALESPPSLHTPWLDLGSGAGLPALPLAVVHPQLSFTLFERRRRRAAFLQLAAARLNLSNVEVVAGEVETFTPTRLFPIVSAQGVGSLQLVYELTRHLHAPTVTLIARKGDDWRRELDELERGLERSALSWREIPLARHGRLISVTMTGGLLCPPSV